ncbi:MULTISPECIES: hypothetical protein [unclassified Micromonospora]|uniref:hypothetical protein n=1 Tax=unclassified Micromonospora TaxID=2617518 RepID=UPI0033206E49
MGKRTTTDSSQDKPPYDMPNMDAVRNETRRLNDPQATYDLAVKARDAQLAGAFRRRPR